MQVLAPQFYHLNAHSVHSTVTVSKLSADIKRGAEQSCWPDCPFHKWLMECSQRPAFFITIGTAQWQHSELGGPMRKHTSKESRAGVAATLKHRQRSYLLHVEIMNEVHSAENRKDRNRKRLAARCIDERLIKAGGGIAPWRCSKQKKEQEKPFHAMPCEYAIGAKHLLRNDWILLGQLVEVLSPFSCCHRLRGKLALHCSALTTWRVLLIQGM